MSNDLEAAFAAARDRVAKMTPKEVEEMKQAQRQSWLRGMQPCEHGIRDFEDCQKCREGKHE